jgi:hypothetical protein
MEASYSLPEGMDTGFKQEHDALWCALKMDSSFTLLPIQPPSPVTWAIMSKCMTQYCDPEVKIHGPNHQGSDRDCAPFQQHQ